MRRFDSGISYYTWAKLPMPFPEDYVCCEGCRLCYADEMKRHRCSWDKHIIYNVERISDFCPLILDGNINEPVQQVDKEVLGVRV